MSNLGGTSSPNGVEPYRVGKRDARKAAPKGSERSKLPRERKWCSEEGNLELVELASATARRPVRPPFGDMSEASCHERENGAAEKSHIRL